MAIRDEVSALLRKAAGDVVMPRYRRLRGAQVFEKSPGEVVTAVDLEVERRLTAGLGALLPGARVVGEEASETDPGLLRGLDRGVVWLLDPLDGTRNYACGEGPFGMMVALVVDGETQLGWMLDPASGRMCFAERGGGAWCNGKRVLRSPPRRARPRAALGTHFLDPARREAVHAAAASRFERVPVPMCAAESYPRLALGEDDVMLFQRTLPWDHAAGALFVTEAGLRITRWDRSPYRAGDAAGGVIAAASEDLWEEAADLLLAPAIGGSRQIERAA